MELSQRPIFIVFESQYREITHPALHLLKEHKSAITLLTWRAGSMVNGGLKGYLTSYLDNILLLLEAQRTDFSGRNVGCRSIPVYMLFCLFLLVTISVSLLFTKEAGPDIC